MSAKRRDNIATRGHYHAAPLGTAVFVGLRMLDPVLQYSILAHTTGRSLIQRLGGSVLASPSRTVLTTSGLRAIDNLDLTPHRLVLLGMAVLAALKQSAWKLFIAAEPMPAPFALAVAAFNTVCNSANDLLFITAATSAARHSGESYRGWPLLLGAGMFAAGLGAELVGEAQRKRFKDDPRNRGRAYTRGLFALARHVNYGGYVLWRTGFALAAAGPAWATAVAAYFWYDFAARGVPVLDEYCEKRYGEEWRRYKADTPYKLFPFVY